MRLWTWKPFTEEEAAIPSMGLRSWRKVLEGKLCPPTIAVTTEMRYGGQGWRAIGTGYLTVTLGRWGWDEYHTWYDGPHCSRRLGFLHLYWSGEECGKCWVAGE